VPPPHGAFSCMPRTVIPPKYVIGIAHGLPHFCPMLINQHKCGSRKAYRVGNHLFNRFIMKKMFFSVLFAVGIIAVSEAQSISLYFKNSTPPAEQNAWNVRVFDSNPVVNYSEITNILPGPTLHSLIPPSWPSFTFPIYWSAQNVTTGCAASGVITGYGATIVPACGTNIQLNMANTSPTLKKFIIRVIN
jgi:hypothetical protein